MEKIVVAGRPDRLGARLKNALSAMDFSRKIGAKLILAWNPIDHYDTAGLPFRDLFDLNRFDALSDEIIVKEEAYKSVLKREGYKKGNSISDFTSLSIEEIAGIPERVIFYDVTRYFPPNSEDALSRMKLNFARWPLAREVEDCFTQLCEEIDFSQSLAVHLRRGDIVHALIDSKTAYGDREVDLDRRVKGFVARYAPVASYLEAIDSLRPAGRIAFFSDDIPLRDELSRRFGERSFAIDGILQNFSLSSAQAALVEFLTISRFNAVLGSSSAFVKFASDLGGARLHDIMNFIRAPQILEDLRAIVVASNEEDKAALYDALISAYRDHFKASGKPLDYEIMASA